MTDEQDEDDEIDGFIPVSKQIEIEREFQDRMSECSGETEEIEGFVEVDEQIRMIEESHREYMEEPDFELGDRLRDDHTEEINEIVHRFQNYDDKEDFLYALKPEDYDELEGYHWFGEEWLHTHYERISKQEDSEEAGDEESVPDETTD